MDLIPEEIPPEGIPLRGTPYVALKRLGQGAQGMALLVRNPDLARLEVMKVLLVAYSEELAHRFKFEAQSIAHIHHPTIVRIYFIGILPDNRAFFTMEYFEGQTLAALLKTLAAPMSVRRAVSIAGQLADGLAACHAKGIVHRDLKPGNILIAPDDTVKIIDFGIAKRAQEHTQLSGGWTQGNLIGTPTFMAPEQAMGTAAAIGPATDVYALACVLYVLLTGRLLYEGNTAEQIYHKLHSPPPTLASAGRGGPFPHELEALVARMLVRDSSARVQSAVEVRQELNRILKLLPAEVTVPVSADAGFDAPTLGATYTTAVRDAAPAPDFANFPTVRDAAPAPTGADTWRDGATMDSPPAARAPEVTVRERPTVDAQALEQPRAPTAPRTGSGRRSILLLVATLVLGGAVGAVLVATRDGVPSSPATPPKGAVSATSAAPAPKPSVEPSPTPTPSPSVPSAVQSVASATTGAPTIPPTQPKSKPSASAAAKPSASSPTPAATPTKGAMDDPF